MPSQTESQVIISLTYLQTSCKCQKSIQLNANVRAVRRPSHDKSTSSPGFSSSLKVYEEEKSPGNEVDDKYILANSVSKLKVVNVDDTKHLANALANY